MEHHEMLLVRMPLKAVKVGKGGVLLALLRIFVVLADPAAET